MSARYHAMTELLELFPNNPVILEAVIKTEDHINTVARNGGKIMVSISGGSDSDIMLDMFERIGYDEGEVVYVWFDTGLEYDATKRHLKYLEQKYGIEIKRYRPKLTVAQVVKQYEPKLYAAACKIFGPSYEYTRKYRAFKESYKREKRRGGQIDLFDDPYERIKEGVEDG